MDHAHHRHRGSVFAGRIMVVVGCLLILGANAWVFKAASARPHPLPGVQMVTIISLIWLYAGAWAMCARRDWGRYLVLAILYAGSLGFFVTGITALTTGEGPLVGRLPPIFTATAAYLYVSLVLTHSKHVRRLTSRAWE